MNVRGLKLVVAVGSIAFLPPSTMLAQSAGLLSVEWTLEKTGKPLEREAALRSGISKASLCPVQTSR